MLMLSLDRNSEKRRFKLSHEVTPRAAAKRHAKRIFNIVVHVVKQGLSYQMFCGCESDHMNGGRAISFSQLKILISIYRNDIDTARPWPSNIKCVFLNI